MNSTTVSKFLLIGIFLFHLAITIHSTYTHFYDFTSFTLYHGTPIAYLLFTLSWLGITLRKKFFPLIYFSLILLELLIRFFFGKYELGAIFGNILFPLDILFFFIVMILYKSIYAERPSRT